MSHVGVSAFGVLFLWSSSGMIPYMYTKRYAMPSIKTERERELSFFGVWRFLFSYARVLLTSLSSERSWVGSWVLGFGIDK